MPVVRVAVERPGPHDQVAFERAGNADLHAKLVGRLGLAFADAVHLGRVPGVELGLSVGGFALAALGHNAMGFVQGLAQCFPHCHPDGAGFAVNLALQSADDGALALDGAAHALELAGMGVAPGLAPQLLALFGEGLLELDAGVFGSLHQLGACRLQQAAVGGVGNGLVLHRAVHDHTGELLRLDQLAFNGHVDGLRQQLFHAFLAQQLAELD